MPIGCCVCCNGEMKDMAHPWKYAHEVATMSGGDYKIQLAFAGNPAICIVRLKSANAFDEVNIHISDLLPKNCYGIYGDVLVVGVREGEIVDLTLDDIMAHMITQVDMESDNDSYDCDEDCRFDSS